MSEKNSWVVPSLLGLLIVTLLGVIAGGIYLFSSSNDNQTSNNQEATEVNNTDSNAFPDQESKLGADVIERYRSESKLANPEVLAAKNQFVLFGNYLESESIWKYDLRGQLADPCVNIDVDTVIQESLLETVIVGIKTTPGDDICIQVIIDYQSTGEFAVSAEADFELAIE